MIEITPGAFALLRSLRVDGYQRIYLMPHAAELAAVGLATVDRYGTLRLTEAGGHAAVTASAPAFAARDRAAAPVQQRRSA